MSFYISLCKNRNHDDQIVYYNLHSANGKSLFTHLSPLAFTKDDYDDFSSYAIKKSDLLNLDFTGMTIEEQDYYKAMLDDVLSMDCE